MDFNKELGVKGFCFRGFDSNDVVAAKVKECGLDRIDLSGPQVPFRDPSTHDAAIEAYRKAGVTITGIGCCCLEGDADDRNFFEFCRKAGCKTITFTAHPPVFWDAVKQAQTWADEYDVRLAIHNHGGKDWLGNSKMLDHVFNNTSERVGLCLDTAWCLQSGEDPVAWVEKFAGRMYGTHFKDFVFDRAGKHTDVVIGTGNLDLKAYVDALKAIDFEGPAVIEYEGDINDPVPALVECVQKMREIL